MVVDQSGKNFTMFECDIKAVVVKMGLPVCQKDLDAGKCGGIPSEQKTTCGCTCSTDLCNSTHRFTPAVGVLMVLMGTMVMRFLAQIMP